MQIRNCDMTLTLQMHFAQFLLSLDDNGMPKNKTSLAAACEDSVPSVH